MPVATRAAPPAASAASAAWPRRDIKGWGLGARANAAARRAHVMHHSTRARANIRPSEPAPAEDREVVKRQDPAYVRTPPKLVSEIKGSTTP